MVANLLPPHNEHQGKQQLETMHGGYLPFETRSLQVDAGSELLLRCHLALKRRYSHRVVYGYVLLSVTIFQI